jgi:hypothetical protein
MIATGPVSRVDVMAQFAPAAPGAQRVSDHQSVRILIATDLLSEGVNLQQASIMIHLDTPWTAARVEQRIGRIARLGSRHERVVSYSIIPSPRAESCLRELEIVTRKSDLAAQILGPSTVVRFAPPPAAGTGIAPAERTRLAMARWRCAATDPASARSDDRPLAAVARAGVSNPVALGAWLVDGAPALLVWDEARGVTSDAASIESATIRADVLRDDDAPAEASLVASILCAADAWYTQRRAWLAIGAGEGLAAAPSAHDARRTLARVADATTASASFARRSQSAAIAARLRNAAATPLPLAVEWSLENLAESADDAGVSTILDLVDRVRPAAERVHETGIRCIALIITR